jgi:hypothetical protein
MYPVSEPVANLITTEDTGVHRETPQRKTEQRLPDVKALPTIEVHSEIL